MRLLGERAVYETAERIGKGESGDTFRATVVNTNVPTGEQELLQHGQEVVIKMSRLPKGPLEERYNALGTLHRLTNAELVNFQRLRGLACVAAVLDKGTYPVTLTTQGEQASMLFIVQQYIRGSGLDPYLKKDNDNYSGAACAADFFDWARMLATALDFIHSRQVIHGDLWPANILIDDTGKPIFIDFGQAIFRDLVFDIGSTSGRNRKYMAPERARSVTGDVYSIGGVLFLIATGRDPFEAIEDIDAVKDHVTGAMLEANPKLYRENCGIADVIARCLRFSRHGRTPHAAALMEDIATFDRRSVSAERRPGAELSGVSTFAGRLEASSSSFFQFAAALQLRRLARDLSDMANGSWDLIGDHETIVSTLTQFISDLRGGDHYYTVSTSVFWLPQNLGINGRFLSMNKLAAQDGAVIRRVFLVTSNEVDTDGHLRRVLQNHLRDMDDLEMVGVARQTPAIEDGGCFTGLWIVEETERDRRMRRGEHYGLLVRGQDSVIMYPIYSEDRQIVMVQFRTGPATEGRVEQVRQALEKARPLSGFRNRLLDPG